jgi:hypothetical protein
MWAKTRPGENCFIASRNANPSCSEIGFACHPIGFLVNI